MRHFLSPQESETFLNWAHRALKENGKLYIFTITPFSKSFKVDKIYNEQKVKSHFYPGYIENVHQYVKVSDTVAPKFSVPDSMLFLCWKI